MFRSAPAVAVALLVAGAVIVSVVGPVRAQESADATRLAVVWTSGDPDVAHRMCLMYTHAAKTAGWFDEVRLVVWGPSARLVAGDKDLQAKLKAMKADGV